MYDRIVDGDGSVADGNSLICYSMYTVQVRNNFEFMHWGRKVVLIEVGAGFLK